MRTLLAYAIIFTAMGLIMSTLPVPKMEPVTVLVVVATVWGLLYWSFKEINK